MLKLKDNDNGQASPTLVASVKEREEKLALVYKNIPKSLFTLRDKLFDSKKFNFDDAYIIISNFAFTYLNFDQKIEMIDLTEFIGKLVKYYDPREARMSSRLSEDVIRAQRGCHPGSARMSSGLSEDVTRAQRGCHPGSARMMVASRPRHGGFAAMINPQK
jgi:hypothetical protein